MLRRALTGRERPLPSDGSVPCFQSAASLTCAHVDEPLEPRPFSSGPALGEYSKLYEYIRSLWATRDDGRYCSIVEPMLQYAKTKSVEKQLSCRARACGQHASVRER